jgi:hypothetical protein
MSLYTIELQTEKVGRGKNAEERQVLCKRVKVFPKKKHNAKRNVDELTGFGVLKFICVRVLLKHKISGKCHKVSMSNASDLLRMYWQLPDKKELPPLRDGSRPMKRNGKVVLDTLAEPVIVPGKRIQIDRDKLNQRVGSALADEVISLLAVRLVHEQQLEDKRKAERDAKAKAGKTRSVPMRKAA